MKNYLLLLSLITSFNTYAFFDSEKNKAEEQKKIVLLDTMGEFNCISYAVNILYCENKVDYCYLYTKHKAGGLSCFKKDKK